MARLIDAKELEKQIKGAFENTNPVLMGMMLRWVRKQTTIDAVPVVRCNACKHRYFNEDIEEYCCEQWADGFDTVCDFEEFCSRGERKDHG